MKKIISLHPDPSSPFSLPGSLNVNINMNNNSVVNIISNSEKIDEAFSDYIFRINKLKLTEARLKKSLL